MRPIDILNSSSSRSKPNSFSGNGSVSLELPALKRILVATDFSISSAVPLRIATHFACALNASLSVFHVFEYGDAASPSTGGTVDGLEALHEEMQRRPDELVQSICTGNIRAHAILKDGLPAESILEVIKEGKFDLVVLGTKASRGMERFVFGSTAEAVLRQAPCPVLTVGPSAVPIGESDQAQRPIVFATDFHLATSHVIRRAASLSELFGAPLHCIHVLPPSTSVSDDVSIVSDLQYILRENGVAVERAICSVVHNSKISDGIVDYARLHEAQMIVLGVRRATMMVSHLPAHITYRIVAESPCAVLTVSM